jgi:hypothetical protein
MKLSCVLSGGAEMGSGSISATVEVIVIGGHRNRA